MCMENARKVSKRILRIRGKYLGVQYMENIANCFFCGTQNCLQIRGKYLNIFGEYVERIYSFMEKMKRDSWRILCNVQQMTFEFLSTIPFDLFLTKLPLHTNLPLHTSSSLYAYTYV